MSDLIRVLHVANSYPPAKGGAAVRMRCFMEALSEFEDLDLHIVTVAPVGMDSDAYEESGRLCIHRVPSQRHLPKEIFQLAKTHQFDLVHAHNARYAVFAEVARRPIFLELHAISDMSGLRGLLTRITCGRAKKIFTLAESATKELQQRFKISLAKLAELRNGVDLARFDPTLYDGASQRESLGISEKEVVIGYAGYFCDWQGVHLLIEGFAAAINNGLQNAKLLLVGNGPSYKSDQQLCEALGIAEHTIFTDHVPFEKVPEYMKAMDIFALARPDTDAAATAVPLKVLEAMAMGICTIVTPVNGLLEVVTHLENGFVTDGFESEEIAKSISTLASDKLLRSRIGEAARQEVSSFNSWHSVAETLATAYRDFQKEGGNT